MELAPDVFDALTYGEFQIKHQAFTRAEDRQRALVLELALNTNGGSESQQHRVQMNINALRQYPKKKWHEQPPASPDSTPSSEP